MQGANMKIIDNDVHLWHIKYNLAALKLHYGYITKIREICPSVLSRRTYSITSPNTVHVKVRDFNVLCRPM